MIRKLITTVSFMLMQTTESYIVSKAITRKLSGHFYKTYQNTELNTSNDNQCLFYTGGSSFIPGELYNSLLHKIADKNITVNVVNKELKDQYILLNTITNKKPTTLIAHSSGAIEALKACNYLDNIKNVVLLDPVDTRFAFDKANKDKIIEPKYKVDDVLFVNAQKSYEWRVFPFKIPFIPMFALTKDNVKFDNKHFITAKQFGHCDVLDFPWGKIMHDTLSEGLNDRDELKIEEYHEWLADVIYNFSVNNTVEVGNDVEYSTN